MLLNALPKLTAQFYLLFDVMSEQSNQTEFDDRTSGTPSHSKSLQHDDGPVDFVAKLSLRLESLEHRVQHLEKVIQRQIRLGRMID